MLETKFSRRLVVLLAALLAVGLAAAPAYAGKTVKTRGGDSFSPNEYLSSTLHFDAGVIFVRPNERVTWVDADKSGDPHSITSVLEKNVPNTVDEIFACPICSLINNHLEDPNDPDSGSREDARGHGPGRDAVAGRLAHPPAREEDRRAREGQGRPADPLPLRHPSVDAGDDPRHEDRHGAPLARTISGRVAVCGLRRVPPSGGVGGRFLG